MPCQMQETWGSLNPRDARRGAHRTGVGFDFGFATNVPGGAVGGGDAGRDAINSRRQDSREFCFGADHQSTAIGFFHAPFGDGQGGPGSGEEGKADRELSRPRRYGNVSELEFESAVAVGSAGGGQGFSR